ncbi:MAG: 2-hydroxyacyl-CoA dehydratase family protein [Myxococcales bacterium]|nr:2-hydroxyacyl-CoA dehydratase family protein [Myxococcales bacterium]
MTDASAQSRKDLVATGVATAYQRAFGKTLQRRVVQEREPFAIAQADTAHEIFHALDIPVVANQWWSAYLSAKRLSGRYLRVLSDHGFPTNSCRYCSLGLGCTLDNDPATAPWGGLPRPTVLAGRMTCDCIQRVFTHWAKALGTHCYLFEAPGWTHKDPRWFEHSQNRWDEVYEARRIDLHVRELEGLIELLESETGRRFDMPKLRALMDRINQQEGLMQEAAAMIAGARPCPVSIVDQIPNVMIPQWHRGSQWALDHAQRFRDEVKARVDQGTGVCENERMRLMWIGAGLWHDAEFYNALETRHGAVFVWSMYLALAGPQYIRFGLNDPLRALASRVCSMNEVLHLPPWMNAWMVSEAQHSGVDAALILVPSGNRQAVSGTLITQLALEAAGIPTLAISADMVDSSDFDHQTVVDHVSEFLTDRVEGTSP